jgi:hypothetical protein
MSGINNINGDASKGENKATPEQDRATTYTPLTEEQIQAAHVGQHVPMSTPSESLHSRTGSTRKTTPMPKPQWSRKFSHERGKMLEKRDVRMIRRRVELSVSCA